MIDVIVPVYTRNDVTKRLARTSIAQLRANTEGIRIIVVDNGWPEDRCEEFPEADLYCWLEENQGYAGGVNHGLEYSKSEMVVVSSIDVFVPPGWLDPLVSAADSEVGVASPAARRFMYDVDLDEWENPLCAYWGGIFAVPRKVVDRVHGFDVKHFPLRYSDTDFAIRVVKAGCWVGRVPEVVVEHRDPSISTLFMPREETDAEWNRLQEIHGEFPMYEWTMGNFL